MVNKFLGELKRRRVVRVAAVYAVTGWTLFQIAASLFPALHLPEWTSTFAAVLLLLCFPIALILAWAFEPAADGVKLTQPAGEDAPAPRWAWADWALAAAVLGVGLVVILQGAGVLRFGAHHADRTGEPAASAAPQPSVAVLPFVNFSDQRDAEFFADGLTDEVTNSLAQVPALRVAGRTSAFYFKGRNEDIRNIGKSLGVAHVLEGSVQRQGDRLRVTVQLIKVADGFHLWSETYDRTMGDAFAVQSEIADSVAGVLKVKLASTAPRPVSPNPEAYRALLVARAQLRTLGLQPLTEARATFKSLIDSGAADAGAYAGYAQATMLLAQNYLALNFQPADAEAKAALDKALALDPNSAEAQVARGYRCVIRMIRVNDQACVAEAADAYAKAGKLKPRDPDVLVGAANFELKRRNPAAAFELASRAATLDPLNRVALMEVANALAAQGRTAEAEPAFLRVIQMFPDFDDAKENLGAVLVEAGQLDRAEPWLRAAAAPQTDPSAALQLAQLYLNLGLRDRFRAVIDSIKAPPAAAAAAQAVPRLADGDFAGVLAYAKAQYAADHDPLFLSAIFNMAIMTGDFEAARRIGPEATPDLFTLDPRVDPAFAYEAAQAAAVFDRLGDHGQAQRILSQLLAVTQPKPGVPQPSRLAIARVQALAELGDKDGALRELRGMIDRGYRNLWDIDLFIRLERYPQMAGLRDDPRFKAMIAEIEADNARMREAVLAAAKR
jgi:TolB-like protein/Tfp pilus assembly protein PilF